MSSGKLSKLLVSVGEETWTEQHGVKYLQHNQTEQSQFSPLRFKEMLVKRISEDALHGMFDFLLVGLSDIII